ncbi:MAG: chaperonin GroEL [Myxococcaceae bacterium]
MPAKQLLFQSEARQKVLRGATQLADAVRLTLGPKSKSVLVERKWGKPLLCDDGFTITKEVELKDPEENLGAQMLKEPAERTQLAVGDGTTTATLLAHGILSEGIRNVVAGASAIDLKRGLDRACRVAIGAIKATSRPVKTRLERAQVATLSAHGSREIGDLVADATEKVGAEGVITVEEAKGTETTLEVVEGMQFDRGYLSPYFITDPERMECVLEDALVLLYEKRLSSMEGLLPLLERVVKTGQSLLVVSEELEGEALATLVVNKMRGSLRCAAVKSPGFGERRRALMEDLAVLTGAQLVTEELGVKLEHVSPEYLGRAKRVVITRDNTTLVGGGGDKRAITGRLELLRREIKAATSDYDREKLQERLAKLSGGVAVIRVGAASEAELKSRKDAFDDAISSTKAAVAEGIVPGAGLAYLRALAALEAEEGKVEGDERTGVRILRHALEVPTRQIAENSDLDPGVVADRMRTGSGAMGLDASRGVYVDLFEAGIIDPTKVVRVALENAVSSASVLLLAEATLTEVPEPRPPSAHAPPFEP